MAATRNYRYVQFYVPKAGCPRLDAWISNNPRAWQAVARDLLELALTEGIVPDSLGHHVSLAPAQGRPQAAPVAQKQTTSLPPPAEVAPVTVPAPSPQEVLPAPRGAESAAENAPQPSGEDLAERLRRAHAKLKGAF